MPKFHLSAEITVSAYTVVEADTLEEAVKIVTARAAVVGDKRTGADEEEEWVVEANVLRRTVRLLHCR